MQPHRLAAPLAVLLPLFLSSCDRRRETVRVGAVAPLTGDSAAFGASARKGYELAVEEWNGRGGLLGKRIELLMADDKGDAGEGASAFTKLIERDKVVGLLGAVTSKVTLAGAPIAQAARLPMITPSATNQKVTDVGEFIFRACYVDAFQGKAGADFAYGDLKARKAMCLFDQGNDYTRGLAEVFRDRFRELGGVIVGFEGHTGGAADLKPQLAKILPAEPDVIFVPDYYNDASVAIRQARELGFKGPLLGADGWDSPTLIPMGGKATEGCFFTAHFFKDDPDPVAQGFVRTFQAKHHVDPDSFATLAYDATCLLLDAIQRAGTTEPGAVRNALANTNLRVVSGQMTFDARRNPVKKAPILELMDGKMVFRRFAKP